jgi:regulator of protease activity HflC (stomatin/prohibitin superfamily)
MCEGREQASIKLREAMQDAADAIVTTGGGKGLGVTIVGVGVEGMHPPVAEHVPNAFQEVVMALTQKETDVLAADANALSTVTAAKGAAQVENLKAQSYYASRVTVAEAEAARFNAQNKAYGHSPTVFKAREYLSALEKGFEDTRKYVIGVKGLDREMIRVNLEDPTSFDLGGIQFEKPVAAENKK